MTNILVVPDQHSHPEHSNVRADYLARLTIDLKPDVVVNLGDTLDLPSLASYDRGKRSFHGKNYQRDIDAHLEFQDRWWGPVRRNKKKLPTSIVLEGNHEHRIERALDLNPEYEGIISFDSLDFDRYYDEIIRYDGGTPGTFESHGVTFAHYLISGVKGLPISGEHHAHSLITKKFVSCVVGHSHLKDECIRNTERSTTIQAVVAGVYQDYDSDWAGSVNKLWWRGLVYLRNVEDGRFDTQWISMAALKKEYGNDGG
jgi:hypothetical protein